MNALWLENWTIVDRETTKTSTTITAAYAVVPDSCPKCGVIDRLYKHGEKVVEYRDAPAYGKCMTIAVKVKRFRCRDCGATTMQPLPDMHPTRQMTLRCAEHLQEQCLTRNYAEMSRETGVDESVIRSLCNEGYEKLKAIRRPVAPTVTEAMNGIVKIINRDGRGYSFEHIRAKVLSAQEEPAMPETIVCECCLGHFPPPVIEAHRIRPFGVGKAKSIRMCANCHRRFHIEGDSAAHRDSTLKNG